MNGGLAVAGYVRDSFYDREAVVWTPGASGYLASRIAPSEWTATLGDVPLFAMAGGINEAAAISGTYRVHTGAAHAFGAYVYDPAQPVHERVTIVPLPDGMSWATANDIGEDGAVVGAAGASTPTYVGGAGGGGGDGGARGCVPGNQNCGESGHDGADGVLVGALSDWLDASSA